jgi:hypothetical protein
MNSLFWGALVYFEYKHSHEIIVEHVEAQFHEIVRVPKLELPIKRYTTTEKYKGGYRIRRTLTLRAEGASSSSLGIHTIPARAQRAYSCIFRSCSKLGLKIVYSIKETLQQFKIKHEVKVKVNVETDN